MKTRNLFLSLFAFAALCACNKEAQPEVPQILEEDAYIKVNIMATDANTRAFDDGVDAENAVYNGLFLFYDASGNYVAQQADFSWTSPVDDNIAKTATIKLPAKSTKPSKMLVVLNYSNASAYTSLDLTNAKKKANENVSIEESGTTYYTMTNSVYSDGSNAVCEVALTDANFGKAANEDDKADAVTPVNVYVERIAAKITINTKTPSIDVNPTDITLDGVPATITPVVKGYTVISTPNKSYDFKNISTSWSYANWNDQEHFRSYWSSMPTSDVTFSEKTYSEIAAITSAGPYYVHENTSLDPHTNTKVILAALLTTDGTTPVDLVKYNNTYYTLSNFIDTARDAVKGSTSITSADLKVKPNTPSAYEMVLELIDAPSVPLTDVEKADINADLAKMPASYWAQGKCYYHTDIKHDLSDASGKLSGVVRNHIYKLTLNSVAGLGVPVPGIGGESIDPADPSDEYYSLNATINILKWKIVEQGVDFNN